MTSSLAQNFDPGLPLRTVAFRSWSSIKTPVMAWLWYMNALYWVGFFYLERPEAFWAVISYIAVGPIVTVMIMTQRGLTRLSGLIHLPWVFFILYLGFRLFTDAAGPAVSPGDGAFYFYWLHLTFWSTLLCLAFDFVDIGRWILGERYVLGTPAAAACGASKLAKQDA